MGAGMIALIAAIAVFALLFMWAPWSGPRTAENSGTGTTVFFKKAPIGADGSEYSSASQHAGCTFHDEVTNNC